MQHTLLYTDCQNLCHIVREKPSRSLEDSCAPDVSNFCFIQIKTMLGGFIIHGYFGLWTLIVKSLGMMLMP